MDTEARIARLERQNRTFRVMVTGLLLGLGLFGAAAFRQGTSVQDVVRAKRFEVIGSAGKEVGFWDASRLALLADDSAGWASTLTAEGVVVGAGKGAGVMLARLGKVEGGQALVLVSAEGEAVLGNTSARNRRSGASTRFPVTTLSFFDSSGTVRYQVP